MLKLKVLEMVSLGSPPTKTTRTLPISHRADSTVLTNATSRPSEFALWFHMLLLWPTWSPLMTAPCSSSTSPSGASGSHSSVTSLLSKLQSLTPGKSQRWSFWKWQLVLTLSSYQSSGSALPLWSSHSWSKCGQRISWLSLLWLLIIPSQRLLLSATCISQTSSCSRKTGGLCFSWAFSLSQLTMLDSSSLGKVFIQASTGPNPLSVLSSGS